MTATQGDFAAINSDGSPHKHQQRAPQNAAGTRCLYYLEFRAPLKENPSGADSVDSQKIPQGYFALKCVRRP